VSAQVFKFFQKLRNFDCFIIIIISISDYKFFGGSLFSIKHISAPSNATVALVLLYNMMNLCNRTVECSKAIFGGKNEKSTFCRVNYI
jgi:hypothetical protein